MQETRDQVIIFQIWSTNMFKRVSVGLYVAYRGGISHMDVWLVTTKGRSKSCTFITQCHVTNFEVARRTSRRISGSPICEVLVLAGDMTQHQGTQGTNDHLRWCSINTRLYSLGGCVQLLVISLSQINTWEYCASTTTQILNVMC